MIIKTPIDLELTQLSGQTSQPPWHEVEGTFSNVVNVDGEPVVFNVKQSGEFLDFSYSGDISQKQASDKLNYIFDLDFDLDKFYKYLANHAELAEMSEFCNGLRLFLAPDPFECVISSICSANNSIKRWTQSVSQIKQNWGNQHGDYYTFPKSNDLLNVYLDDEEESDLSNIQDISKCTNNLKNCGVGYRAPYMRRASEMFTDEIDLQDIFRMSYDEAFETILKVPESVRKLLTAYCFTGLTSGKHFPQTCG